VKEFPLAVTRFPQIPELLFYLSGKAKKLRKTPDRAQFGGFFAQSGVVDSGNDSMLLGITPRVVRARFSSRPQNGRLGG